jgi:hypothetical protein
MSSDTDTDDPEEIDPFQVESRLTSHGVYVDEFTVEGGDYFVSYESIAADDGAIPHQEVGRVLNVLLDLHPGGWDGTNVEGTVLNLDGEVEGTWHVEDQWLVDLDAYRLTETEFSQKVIETIEPVGGAEADGDGSAEADSGAGDTAE